MMPSATQGLFINGSTICWKICRSVTPSSRFEEHHLLLWQAVWERDIDTLIYVTILPPR